MSFSDSESDQSDSYNSDSYASDSDSSDSFSIPTIPDEIKTHLQSLVQSKNSVNSNKYKFTCVVYPKSDHELTKGYLLSDDFLHFIEEFAELKIKPLTFKYRVDLVPYMCEYPNIEFIIQVIACKNKIHDFCDELVLACQFIHPLLLLDKKQKFIGSKVFDPCEKTRLENSLEFANNRPIRKFINIITEFEGLQFNHDINELFCQQLALHQYLLPDGFKHTIKKEYKSQTYLKFGCWVERFFPRTA